MKEFYHARPSRTLIILILCLTHSTCAFSGTESSGSSELRHLWTAIAALAVAVLVHIVIPLIRSLYESRRSRQHYFSYLWVNVTNTLSHYGEEQDLSISELDYPERNIAKDQWHVIIKQAGLKPPALLRGLANSLLIAEFDEDSPDYIPYISYVGFQTVILDHDHPIWKLSSGVKTVSTFLSTQAHCKEQITYLYEEPFYNLITQRSDTREQAKANKIRWVRGAEAVMCDLAENYVAAVHLKNFLESQGVGK